MMTTCASVVMVTTGGPVFVLVIAVPAVRLAAGPGLVGVALAPAAEGRRVLVGGAVMLPGARSPTFPTSGRPLLRGEAAVRLLLQVVLPHVHLEEEGKKG